MTTGTLLNDLRNTLDSGNPNNLGDVLALVKLGTALSPIKATFTALASAAAQDITTAAAKAAAVRVGIDLETGENLPAALVIQSVRVTAGAAAAGPRQLADSGGTPSATVATVSDDGKTITFEAGVTAFVIVYHARPFTALTTSYPTQGTGG